MRIAHAATVLAAGIACGGLACGGARPAATGPAVRSPAPAPEARTPSARARVTGRLRTADGRPLLSGALVIVPVDPERGGGAVKDARILADGSFAFYDVPPGRYEIRARAETERNGTPLVATFGLSVDRRDVTNLQMTLAPGARVSGTIEVEAERGDPPRRFKGVHVRAPFADGSSFGDAVTGEVGHDRSFTVQGLMTGGHVLALEGLQDPWVLKRVTYRGQDVTDSGFDVEAGERLEGMRMVITDVAAEVTGTVTDARGAVGGALVIVVPGAAEYWTRASRRLRVVRADASGRYRVRGLPPGEYRIAAATDLDEGAVHRPGVLRDLSSRGTPLTVSAIEPHVLDLSVPASAARRRPSTR